MQIQPTQTRKNTLDNADVAIQAAQSFYIQKQKYFASEKKGIILASLKKLNEEQINSLDNLSFKNPTAIFLVSFFFGWFGVDRFMLGQIGLGIVKLITFGGVGFWWLIDLFFVISKTKEQNFTKLRDAVSFF